MLTGEQQQQLIFGLAERGRILCRLLRLPDAQAEAKSFSGAFLGQAGGEPEFTDVGLYADGLL